MGEAVTILSRDEVAGLAQSKRPLNYRVTSKIYHDVFETVGRVSLCQNDKGAFDPMAASERAVDLCLKIAEELERLGVEPKRINETAPALP